MCSHGRARFEFICGLRGDAITLVQVTKNLDEIAGSQTCLHLDPLCLAVTNAHDKGLLVGSCDG